MSLWIFHVIFALVDHFGVFEDAFNNQVYLHKMASFGVHTIQCIKTTLNIHNRTTLNMIFSVINSDCLAQYEL